MNNLMHEWRAPLEEPQVVLFVDDEIKIRKGIQRLFQQYQVPWVYRLADGVDEAITILQEQAVDVVVSDINMPHQDGFYLLTLLRNNPLWNDLPVIILTGIANQGLKSKALELGATDLLNKPVFPDDLLARIRSALHIKRCQDIIKKQNFHLEELIGQRTAAIEATRLDIIWRLGNAAEFRNGTPGNHVVRVGYYSKIIAEKLGMDKKFIDMIFLASPLHDLGKIAIPDSILLKPGWLTDEELVVMRTHCKNGQKLLNSFIFEQASCKAVSDNINDGVLLDERNPLLQMASDIAGYHHEQWNGSGYPYQKKQEEIPISSRIVAIGDVFDALRNNRSDRAGIGHGETLAIMRKENAFRFDPDIFSVFEKSLSDFQDIHNQYKDSNAALISSGFIKINSIV